MPMSFKGVWMPTCMCSSATSPTHRCSVQHPRLGSTPSTHIAVLVAHHEIPATLCVWIHLNCITHVDASTPLRFFENSQKVVVPGINFGSSSTSLGVQRRSSIWLWPWELKEDGSGGDKLNGIQKWGWGSLVYAHGLGFRVAKRIVEMGKAYWAARDRAEYGEVEGVVLRLNHPPLWEQTKKKRRKKI